MSGINQMEYFQSIVDEFTGTEFTTEDLMDKTLSSKEEIPCDVWLSKDKFSIIHVEEYPELSEEELELLSEIKGKYGFISEEQSPPHFMEALKIHRKNIVQWHGSLFPKPVIIEDIDKEDLAQAVRIKEARCSTLHDADIWTELYANDEYSEKIMKSDIDGWVKQRERDKKINEITKERVPRPSREARKARLMRGFKLNMPEPGDVSGILIRDPDGNVRANISI